MKIVAIIVVICFVLLFLFLVVLGYKNSHKKIAEYKQHTEEVYGSIQFKGQVLRIHKIKRGGRVYGIVCIKLDYCNIDSLYIFDKMSCLKIENGVVTLPSNSISIEDDRHVRPILDAVYVEVNMENSKQMVFIDSLGNKFFKDLDYPNNNLIESDLRLCDDCEILPPR